CERQHLRAAPPYPARDGDRMREYRGRVAGDLLAELNRNIVALARTLLPNGTQEGSEYLIGSLAGERGRSLRIHVDHDDKCGLWCDFATGIGGNALYLIALVLFAGDRARAVLWAWEWLTHENAGVPPARSNRRDASVTGTSDAEARSKKAAAIFT